MIDIFSLVKNIGKIESKAADFSAQLKNKTVVGSSGGGMVEVTCNGKKDVLDIKIEDGLETDPKMLKDLIISAISQAQKNAEALFIDEAKKMVSKFNL